MSEIVTNTAWYVTLVHEAQSLIGSNRARDSSPIQARRSSVNGRILSISVLKYLGQLAQCQGIVAVLFDCIGKN